MTNLLASLVTALVSRRWAAQTACPDNLTCEWVIPEMFSTGPLGGAIENAQDYLVKQQQPDGHWVAELTADTTLTAEYIMLMHMLGRVDEEKQRKGINYIRTNQLANGGWNIYHAGPSEITATVKAYFAGKLAGYSPDEPWMRRARECALRLGGVTEVNCFCKFYLAVMGQYDWEGVPAIPPELVLLPRWFYMNVYAMSSWSRAIVVPLSIIAARRPSFAIPADKGIAELYRVSRDKVDHRLSKGDNPWKNLFIDVDYLLRHYEENPSRIMRRYSIKQAEKWVCEHLRKSGGLGAIWPAIYNTILAFKCLDYPDDHPLLKKSIQDIEDLGVDEGDSFHMTPCVSPVWDTAWAALALSESGVPNNDPILTKACDWLLTKEAREYGDWKWRALPCEPSGWYFEYENEFYPDCDDSPVVLMALQKSAASDSKAKADACRRGFSWQMAMQNTDGGWGAFDRNNNREILVHIPWHDFGALLDPSTADLTGRTLEIMGWLGCTMEDERVRRAVRFLKAEQEEDGSWYGRWGVNYLYGTWSVLYGLHKIGEDMTKPYVRKAVAWLTKMQKADGGWGETIASYEDPDLKWVGDSTPSQTAWALLGLMAAGEQESDAVKRGVDYLLTNQTAEGTWEEDYWTGTGFPRVFYLKYNYYRHYFPLLALARYRQLTEQD